MNELKQTKNWLAGLQWFFFIFANIVIVPITVGEAFGLTKAETVPIIQLSFIVTGLACLAQAFLGHKRPLLEGHSGLWWGIYLTLIITMPAQGMSLEELGGSLALGVIISGVITILIGVTGLSPYIGKIFTPAVMGVFMFLLGLTLIQIFFKGMLGIPFGISGSEVMIDVPVAGLGIVIALLVVIISIKSTVKVRSYAILIGIVVGWIAYALIFGPVPMEKGTTAKMSVFPYGALTWNTGIVLTAILAGLLNVTNTFGALRGTDSLLQKQTTNKDYKATFSISGIATIAAGVFGLVPYIPFVSSIGFLRQTNLYNRLPFIIGSSLFLMMGIIQPVGAFFSTLPLSIGSAVLFVAYLQFFNSSWDLLRKIPYNSLNVYRTAIPLFVGAIIMMFPTTYFESLPEFIRPFLSNGLLVGIVLAILLENIINWDRIGSEWLDKD